MKYKHIKGMLHDFGQSFVSMINEIDAQDIPALMVNLAGRLPGQCFEIGFMSGQMTPEIDCAPALRHSILVWKKWLPRLAENCRLDLARLSQIRLHFQLGDGGHVVRVSALDDRGQAHEALVRTNGLRV